MMRASAAWPCVGGLVVFACGGEPAVSTDSLLARGQTSSARVLSLRDRVSDARSGSLPEQGPLLARLQSDLRVDPGNRSEGSSGGVDGLLREREPIHSGPPGAEARAIGSELLDGNEAESPVRVLFSGDEEAGRVALTFDDGPSRENTPRILSTLRRHGVRATFFVEGRRVRRFPDLARRIVSEGHEIAIHGWSHRSFRSLGPSELRREVADTRHAIREATGLDPRLLRPPFGRFAESALALFSELGVDVVLWSVDSEDWAGDPQQMIRNATAVEPGDIVLLHDRISSTADAVSAIVERVRDRGLKLVTVSELTRLDPYEDRSRRSTDESCLGGAMRP